MKKSLLLALILSGLLIACQDDKDKLNNLIEKSLSSNRNVEKVFLNLEFGMSEIEFKNELRKTYRNGKIKLYINNNYAYEFKGNERLKGIDWMIGSSLHNDTVIGIKLYSYKRLWKNSYNTIHKTYREIINEYKLVYGEPSYSKGEFENYWIKDNLLISVTESPTVDVLGGSININYDDKRKEKSIKLIGCRFDKNGNTMDKWYYDLKEKGKPKNKDI